MVSDRLPDYLCEMVRRSVPSNVVFRGSTPFFALGDPTQSEIATLGINPSKREFVENARLLRGSARRLATLESLGANDLASLSDEQIGEVIDDCARYFDSDRNPYGRWFNPLDKLLRDSADVSFYDGTACHLDLVQWATDPVWGELSDETKQLLLDDGVPHLLEQLRHENIRLVLLNGRSVLDQVQAVGLATLSKEGVLPLGKTTCTLYVGKGEGIRFLGWSTNLQSSRGVSRDFTASLAEWIRATIVSQGGDAEGKGGTVTSPDYSSLIDEDGHLDKGVSVSGKRELHDLLSVWFQRSDAGTIGGERNYAGTPWVFIRLAESTRAALNADTTRRAVKKYLDDARTRGADARWHVILNNRGKVNKVVFGENSEATPGWFCYLTEPLESPRAL